MRNRELLMNKIEYLENRMNVMKNNLNGSYPISEFVKNIDLSKEIIEEVKSIISREPLSPEELNKTR